MDLRWCMHAWHFCGSNVKVEVQTRENTGLYTIHTSAYMGLSKLIHRGMHATGNLNRLCMHVDEGYGIIYNALKSVPMLTHFCLCT